MLGDLLAESKTKYVSAYDTWIMHETAPFTA
jgi:hypothetical protein